MRHLLLAGLISGLAAGLALTLAQQVWVVPLIVKAEAFEHGAAGRQPPPEEAGAGPGRLWYALAANCLAGIGFGLVLAGVFALRRGPVDGLRGTLWGLGGFAVFIVAPALGLPPELPGSGVGGPEHRQIWWAAAVAAAAAGLPLFVFARKGALRLAGLVLAGLPHLVGAPTPEAVPLQPPPAELARTFVVAALATAGLFWVVLGGVCGWAMRRLR